MKSSAGLTNYEATVSEYVRGLRDALEIADRQRSKFHARDWDDAITAVMERIEDWAQESQEYAASNGGMDPSFT